MPIIFKPVGTSGPRKLEIRNDTIGPITLIDIEAIFNAYGITEEEMENIKKAIEEKHTKELLTKKALESASDAFK